MNSATDYTHIFKYFLQLITNHKIRIILFTFFSKKHFKKESKIPYVQIILLYFY